MASAEPIFLCCRRLIQPAKDIDLTCFKTFSIKATTCLQVGPMSLDWPVDPIGRFDQSSPSSSPEDPNNEHQEGALPASTRCRWRRDALQPPQVQYGTAGRDTCGHFSDGGLQCIAWNTRVSLDRFFPRRKTVSSNSSISGLQEVHGKDEFLQAIQVMVPRFRFFFVLSFLGTRMQEDRPSASARNFCLRMLL